MRPITEVEARIIAKLLLSAGPVGVVETDVRALLAEEIDAQGSVRLSDGTPRPLDTEQYLVGDGVFSGLDGTRVRVLLFARSGHLDELELYRDDLFEGRLTLNPANPQPIEGWDDQDRRPS